MRDSPIHPPTLPQFVAACADMPVPKTEVSGISIQEQLVAYVTLNCHPSIEQMAKPWTYQYRTWDDPERPKQHQSCAECTGVIVPAVGDRESICVTVISMLGDQEGHARALASFRPSAFLKKVV
jgi:hypothetical protein